MREEENHSRPLAKRLRGGMTDAEIILWSYLRRRASIYRLHFRRQHPIGPYVADFACVTARVVIEVDGATHSTPEEISHDRRRDAYLRNRGWRVLRVSNTEIYRNIGAVLDDIDTRMSRFKKS
jgi:very-short-patch-repair endonuclease